MWGGERFQASQARIGMRTRYPDILGRGHRPVKVAPGEENEHALRRIHILLEVPDLLEVIHAAQGGIPKSRVWGREESQSAQSGISVTPRALRTSWAMQSCERHGERSLQKDAAAWTQQLQLRLEPRV